MLPIDPTHPAYAALARLRALIEAAGGTPPNLGGDMVDPASPVIARMRAAAAADPTTVTGLLPPDVVAQTPAPPPYAGPGMRPNMPDDSNIVPVFHPSQHPAGVAGPGERQAAQQQQYDATTGMSRLVRAAIGKGAANGFPVGHFSGVPTGFAANKWLAQYAAH